MADDRRIEREIMAKVRELHDKALADFQAHDRTVPRRMNRDQAARHAYLTGVLHGLFQAYREFERRQPIEFAEASGDSNG